MALPILEPQSGSSRGLADIRRQLNRRSAANDDQVDRLPRPQPKVERISRGNVVDLNQRRTTPPAKIERQSSSNSKASSSRAAADAANEKAIERSRGLSNPLVPLLQSMNGNLTSMNGTLNSILDVLEKQSKLLENGLNDSGLGNGGRDWGRDPRRKTRRERARDRLRERQQRQRDRANPPGRVRRGMRAAGSGIKGAAVGLAGIFGLSQLLPEPVQDAIDVADTGADVAGAARGAPGRPPVPGPAPGPAQGGLSKVLGVGGKVLSKLAVPLTIGMSLYENSEELSKSGKIDPMNQIKKVGGGLMDIINPQDTEGDVGGMHLMKRVEGVGNAISGATGAVMGVGTEVGAAINKMLPTDFTDNIVDGIVGIFGGETNVDREKKAKEIQDKIEKELEEKKKIRLDAEKKIAEEKAKLDAEAIKKEAATAAPPAPAIPADPLSKYKTGNSFNPSDIDYKDTAALRKLYEMRSSTLVAMGNPALPKMTDEELSKEQFLKQKRDGKVSGDFKSSSTIAPAAATTAATAASSIESKQANAEAALKPNNLTEVSIVQPAGQPVPVTLTDDKGKPLISSMDNVVGNSGKPKAVSNVVPAVAAAATAPPIPQTQTTQITQTTGSSSGTLVGFNPNTLPKKFEDFMAEQRKLYPGVPDADLREYARDAYDDYIMEEKAKLVSGSATTAGQVSPVAAAPALIPEQVNQESIASDLLGIGSAAMTGAGQGTRWLLNQQNATSAYDNKPAYNPRTRTGGPAQRDSAGQGRRANSPAMAAAQEEAARADNGIPPVPVPQNAAPVTDQSSSIAPPVTSNGKRSVSGSYTSTPEDSKYFKGDLSKLNGMDPVFVEKLKAASTEAGVALPLTSGFRSQEKQNKLRADAVKKYGSEEAASKWVAKTSIHTTGNAADFSMGGDAEKFWRNNPKLVEAMEKQGLHRPLGHEPWHWESDVTKGEGRKGLAAKLIEQRKASLTSGAQPETKPALGQVAQNTASGVAGMAAAAGVPGAGAAAGAIAGAPKVGQKITKITEGMSLADMLSVHESKGNYNIFNQGKAHGYKQGEKDFSKMTLNEVMAQQNLDRSDPNKLFAIGKYQIIPDTLKAAAKSMGLKGDEKFTPELQDKIFNDYLVQKKQSSIGKFIKTGEGLDKAAHASGAEWASVGVESKGGKSLYGGVNKAFVSPEQMKKTLIETRQKYQQAISEGKTEIEAMRLATLGSSKVTSVTPPKPEQVAAAPEKKPENAPLSGIPGGATQKDVNEVLKERGFEANSVATVPVAPSYAEDYAKQQQAQAGIAPVPASSKSDGSEQESIASDLLGIGSAAMTGAGEGTRWLLNQQNATSAYDNKPAYNPRTKTGGPAQYGRSSITPAKRRANSAAQELTPEPLITRSSKASFANVTSEAEARLKAKIEATRAANESTINPVVEETSGPLEIAGFGDKKVERQSNAQASAVAASAAGAGSGGGSQSSGGGPSPERGSKMITGDNSPLEVRNGESSIRRLTDMLIAFSFG